MSMDYNKLPWRVGTKVRRTIYAIIPDVEHEDHPLIGLMDTPQLAVEVVGSHNKMLHTTTYAEKEILLKDLEITWELWKDNQELEGSIMLATGGGDRARHVYEAIGAWVDILGTDKDMPKVFSQAINQIRSS